MEKILNFCKISGDSVKKYDGKRKYIATGDISNNKIISFKEVYYDNKPSRANQNVEIGDVIFAKMQNTKKVIIINEENVNNIYSTGFYVIKPKENVTSKFLFWLFNSKKFNNDKDKNCKGATQKAINNEGLKKIEINTLPLLKEQLNIVNELDMVQDIIDIRKKQIEKLDELIKSQFIKMFGTIKNTKFNTKTLIEITKDEPNSIKRGPFGGSLKKDDFVESGYLVYEQRHAIHNDFEYEKYYITEEKYNDMIMFKVNPKDLLISCSGVTLGRIAEVPQNAKKGIINQALLKITLDSNVMNNVYFIHHFRSNEVQEKLFSFSRGSGIPNFPSMNEVKKIKFVCPPIELQNKFADFVKQIDKQKFEMQRSLEEAQKLQESLMNKYFG